MVEFRSGAGNVQVDLEHLCTPAVQRMFSETIRVMSEEFRSQFNEAYTGQSLDN